MCLVWSKETRLYPKKKTFTYKEQCPLKQEVYKTELQNGKTPVFIDESGFSIESVRQYAYAPKGVSIEGTISSNQYRHTSLIAARVNGCFTVTMLFEGACDGLAFNAWLENMLCPILDASHVVVLDKASFHKGKKTKELVAACDASLLFLPPYSPELNPIEKDFANIKRKREYNPNMSIDEIIKVYR